VGNTRIINGEMFKNLLLGGVSNLQSNVKEVNELNVFPIPDGDTGENMYLTLKGGVDELARVEADSLCVEARALAQGMLLNARGNSGVILSQLFYGLAEGLEGLETAGLTEFAEALKQGVKCAYGAVAVPVEGTILTVAREAVENATKTLQEDMTAQDFFAVYLDEMKKSLDKTPELLASLKEAGVIDSGGAGLVYIIEGFCKVLGGESVERELAVASVVSSQKSLDFSKFTEDTEMKYGYCTEMLLRLQNAKTNIAEFSVSELIAFLDTIGDSIVAFQTGSVVKIHVHTLTPWKVLEYTQQFGEYLSVKIENMTLQHNETVEVKPEKKTRKRARRKYAVVTVASGDGLIQTFKDLGADYVVSGGQTNNPSAEDFIEAFEDVNADYVFVLPNNGNIVLAAKQAASMYEDSDVRVVESKSIGEGYSALSMLDYEMGDVDDIVAQMQESIGAVTTGFVTHAIRTTSVDGVHVEKGDFIGSAKGKMLVSTKSKTETATTLMDKIATGKEFLIAVYGAGATKEEREIIANHAQGLKGVEFYEIDGGQDVYDFLFIVE
jgi:DAK2 domain fusion protein YloV